VKRLGNRLHAARTKDESLELFVLLSRPTRSWRSCHFPFTVPTSLQPIGATGFTCFCGLALTLGAAV
jgi:hypothetical protein